MDEVVLVGFWTSPYVMRVKIALLEKGVEYVSPSSFLSTLMRFGRSKKNSSSLMILTTEPEPGFGLICLTRRSPFSYMLEISLSTNIIRKINS